MIGDMPAEQVREAVERVAAEVLARAAIARPPVDALAVARRSGLAVARDDAAGVRARFVKLSHSGGGARGAILVADDERPERRQWAVAHELGEAHAHRVFAELGVAPREAPDGAREAVANRLAGCLLLPRAWFLAAGCACGWDLMDLKAQFSTASHELIARRMLEAPPPVIITLWDHDRLRWRRSHALGRTPPLAACEADARRTAHECGRPARCERRDLPDGVADVRAWPIHEAGWKREIVRAELGEAW
jgi:hypothetical protein